MTQTTSKLPASLVPLSLQVTQDAIMLYAAITDDFNPIHCDPEFAARTPMAGVIAHGTMSMNLIWQSLSKTFDAATLAGATLQIRFIKPVRLGNRVESGGALDPEQPGRYKVWVRTGEPGTEVIAGTVTLA